jgi:hypothetical protein
VNEVSAAVLYAAFCEPKLRALMEFAMNVLISATCLKHKTVFRFAFLRSDLSRHHIEINPGNLPVPQTLQTADSATQVFCLHDALRTMSHERGSPRRFVPFCSPRPLLLHLLDVSAVLLFCHALGTLV